MSSRPQLSRSSIRRRFARRSRARRAYSALSVKRPFDAEPHYLLAAASHLRDEGLLDEDYELANKLGIATGDAALVLRRAAASQSKAVNHDALISEFYPGAESDPHSRSLLVEALEVMHAAVAELRNEDELMILAK